MKVLNYGSLNYDYVYEVDHINQPGETQSCQAGMYTAAEGPISRLPWHTPGCRHIRADRSGRMVSCF